VVSYVTLFKKGILVYNIAMKKINLKEVMCAFVLVVVFFEILPNVAFAKTPGETLKDMGYVIGFADGKLHEERVMNQGELVALVVRYIEKNLIPKKFSFLTEKNDFDRFVNRGYNFFKISYYKLRYFSIKAYYEISSKDIYPGVDRSHYLFSQIVLLKAYGFRLPDGIDVDAKLTGAQFFNIIYGMLGIDETEFILNGELPQSEKMLVLSVVHGKRGSSLSHQSDSYITRNKAFEEFLRLIQPGA
jgi:hypothetical protein